MAKIIEAYLLGLKEENKPVDILKTVKGLRKLGIDISVTALIKRCEVLKLRIE